MWKLDNHGILHLGRHSYGVRFIRSTLPSNYFGNIMPNFCDGPLMANMQSYPLSCRCISAQFYLQPKQYFFLVACQEICLHMYCQCGRISSQQIIMHNVNLILSKILFKYNNCIRYGSVLGPCAKKKLTRNFDIVTRNFDLANSKFRHTNSKFRLRNSKFDLLTRNFDIANSKFRHGNWKFRHRNLKFRLNKLEIST